ncbi:hypothetical protein RND81_14G150400 [Saponaria officinalis]|uniref:arogenate dehydratase n=1 Tax=Saponaria officinalis TaxID=3572 RepID=A0AAW1GR10_SAPOF
MHAFSPPPSNSLTTRQLDPTLHRVTPPSQLSLRCNSTFSSRADWQSACSIFSSHHHNNNNNNSDEKSTTSVNGNNTAIDLFSISNNKTENTTTLTKTNNLPKPLTNDPTQNSTLRVAYQGVPGAYSEAAAEKAYPNSEAIPCDQFEVAFQAVELWIADRAVLPVENSLGGSIHRNYDLLLRHRLHIVGEVQLPVHHCLLVLPGNRKEFLTRVISHAQALAQCENTLTKMGLSVTREAVDDTAGAAQYVAVNGLRDTAAIASARAAQLYGLQVFFFFSFLRLNFKYRLFSHFLMRV